MKIRFPLASKRVHREGHFKGINTGTVSMVIKTLYPLLLVCLILSLMLGCTASSTAPPTSDTPSVLADRVEVVYFHRTQRCGGCIYAEEGIRHTIKTYFTDELTSGKLTFEVVNVQDGENAAIVEKYGAFTSSLFVNTIRDGTEHIDDVTDDIWLLLGNDEEFVEEVKSKIEISLGEVK